MHYFLQKALSHVNLPATSTQNAILNQNVHKMHFFKPRGENKTSIKASLPSLIVQNHYTITMQGVWTRFSFIPPRYTKSTSQKSQKSRLGPIKSSIFCSVQGGSKNSQRVPYLPLSCKIIILSLCKVVEHVFLWYHLDIPKSTSPKPLNCVLGPTKSRIFFGFCNGQRGPKK